MRLSISHSTTYSYDEPVPYGLQQVRLVPHSGSTQTVISWETTVTGGRKELSYQDHHANTVELFSFDPDGGELGVSAVGVVETDYTSGVFNERRGFAPLWLFGRSTPLTEAGPQVAGLLAGDTELSTALANESGGATDDVSLLHRLAATISETVAYTPGGTQIASNVEDVIASGVGVCQDHSHVFISAARLLGVPARYVSGYLMMDDRVEQDATHAWAEAHVDGLGWVGFDVSNGISPDDRYVRIATGLDYQDAAPISGVRQGGSGEQLRVAVQVQQ